VQFDFNSYFFKIITEVTKEYIRHILLYEFNKGNNATESARNIKAVYEDWTISVSQCQRWFQKFRVGNYSLEDKPRPGRSVELDEDLQILVEQNPIVIVEELAEKLGFGQPFIDTCVPSEKSANWVNEFLTYKKTALFME